MKNKEYSVEEIADSQKEFFFSGHTLPFPFRKNMLNKLGSLIQDNEAELLRCLEKDLGKKPIESYASEIGLVLSDINHTTRNLPKWMRVRHKHTPIISWPGKSGIYPEPYGTALIIGPWNYPFQLLLSPLIGAMAAGNCACIKPSELAPATSETICGIINSEFPSEYLRVVEGAVEVTQKLLDQKFDYIFFTGSSRVGEIIMSSAARHLTPVTLELGGKCPCFVCADAKLEVAAKRILWGKLLNAGQTCVAPDYLLAHEDIVGKLLDLMNKTLHEFFGESDGTQKQLAHIINKRHFNRLIDCLEHGRIIAGGKYDEENLFIYPTIMTDVKPDSPLMKEEIFGPILPVVTFKNIDDELRKLRGKPKPLALYLFSENPRTQERILTSTSSGGVGINDTISHILNKNLPFGGIGQSGMGSYHGKAGFDCFTHYKSFIKRSTKMDPQFQYWPIKTSLDSLKKAYNFITR